MSERVEFLLRPSHVRRRLCQLELAGGAVLFAILLSRQPLAWWLAPAALMWFGAGVWRLREPVRTVIRAADGWWLREGAGPAVAMRIVGAPWFGPGLAVLRLLPADGAPGRLLAVWPDSLADQERRRLYRAITAAN